MYWGAVFPLGMYAACTMRMMDAMDLGFLGLLPHVAFIAGLAAWALLFIGQLRALRRHWSAAATRCRIPATSAYAAQPGRGRSGFARRLRSEEHTSELQSLMRIS